MGYGRRRSINALASAPDAATRLLHIGARLVRTARQTRLRLPEHWPWADDLHRAYRQLAPLGT